MKSQTLLLLSKTIDQNLIGFRQQTSELQLVKWDMSKNSNFAWTDLRPAGRAPMAQVAKLTFKTNSYKC